MSKECEQFKKDQEEIDQKIAAATERMGNATAWMAMFTIAIVAITLVDNIFYYVRERSLSELSIFLILNIVILGGIYLIGKLKLKVDL